ncbi:hypothetical protein [Streptomyces sp. NPDC020983]|uniref:hypothetical protein n=1 Tax=Streptomyces sp. NPDC020983 TaxID=3365106 RepID=UPI0037AE65C4
MAFGPPGRQSGTGSDEQVGEHFPVRMGPVDATSCAEFVDGAEEEVAAKSPAP